MRIIKFLLDETGAVTVDWTVLAAAVVGLGVSTVGAVRTGVVSLSGDINGSLSSASVASLLTLGSGGALIVAEEGGMSFPIASTDEDFATMLTQLEPKTEDELARLYNLTFSRAQSFTASGDLSRGAIYLDQAAAVHQTMTGRGYDIPETEISFEDTYRTIVG